MGIMVLSIAAALTHAGYDGKPHGWSACALWMGFTCRWWAPREVVGLSPRPSRRPPSG